MQVGQIPLVHTVQLWHFEVTLTSTATSFLLLFWRRCSISSLKADPMMPVGIAATPTASTLIMPDRTYGGTICSMWYVPFIPLTKPLSPQPEG